MIVFDDKYYEDIKRLVEYTLMNEEGDYEETVEEHGLNSGAAYNHPYATAKRVLEVLESAKE